MAEDRGRHDDHPLWTLVSRRRTKGHPACLLVADAHLFVGVTTSFLMAFLTIHHLALRASLVGAAEMPRAPLMWFPVTLCFGPSGFTKFLRGAYCLPQAGPVTVLCTYRGRVLSLPP